MIQAVKRIVIRNLLAFVRRAGYIVQPSTPAAEVRALVDTLKPRDPGCGFVRLGGPHDGGYLIPNDLDGIMACFSPGVALTSAFERDCLDRGMALYLSDASVTGAGPELTGRPYHFQPKFIGLSQRDDFMSLPDWVAAADLPDGDLLLQMDIEGAEYENLLACPPSLVSRFRVICLEIHHVCEWWNPRFFSFVAQALGAITASHHCVHIHPNNTSRVTTLSGITLVNTLELTFLRKDRVTGGVLRTDFPHPLDADCVPRLPHLALPKDWWG
jgi:hypothetical protein